MSSYVMSAKIDAYEKAIASGQAKIAVIIEEIQEEMANKMTQEEWSRSLRGLWPDMSARRDLEKLSEKYGDYLGLQGEMYDHRNFMAQEDNYSWYQEYLD